MSTPRKGSSALAATNQTRDNRHSAGRPRPVAALLALLGAWSVATPYADGPLGVRVDVLRSVEVVDHVVPGLVIVVAAAGMWVLFPRSGAGSHAPWLVLAAAVSFLAGLWMTSTHVPLLFQAADAEVPWGAAIFHSTAGPVVMALSLWPLVRAVRTLEQAEPG